MEEKLNDNQKKAILAIIEYGVLETKEGEVTLYFDAQGIIRKVERRQTLKKYKL
jgi:hypothetical protein